EQVDEAVGILLLGDANGFLILRYQLVERVASGLIVRIRGERTLDIAQCREDRSLVTRERRRDAGLGAVEICHATSAVEDRPTGGGTGGVKAGVASVEQMLGTTTLHAGGATEDQVREEVRSRHTLLGRRGGQHAFDSHDIRAAPKQFRGHSHRYLRRYRRNRR